MRPLSRLLIVALLANPAGAQIKAVPEVAAPMGGSGVAGAGTQSLTPTLSPAPGLAAPSLPSALPSALPTAQPKAAGAAAAALPASAVPAAALPAAPAAAQAQAPSAPAPVKGLEGVVEKTGEMAQIMGREGGGAAAGAQASGVAAALFDGGAKASPVNAVSEEAPSGYGGAGGGGAGFIAALSRGGIPTATLRRLADTLKTGHPGDQTKVYHGLSHSVRVANVASLVVDGPAGRSLTPEQRNTLLVAAALHDYDPERAPGSPARVSATLDVLAKDSSGLMKELAAAGVDLAAVRALIKYTDFHPDPAERAKMRAEADAMAGAPWVKAWGPRLAFVDQSAMYVDSPAFARQAVVGLANELNAPADKVLAGTHNFLKPLLESPDFALLPPALQANFRAVHRYFVTLAESAASAPSTAEAARAPPSGRPLAALRRLSDALAAQADRTKASLDPEFYKQTLSLLTAQLKDWKASPASAKARAGGTVAGLQTTQAAYKAKLLEAAREHLKSVTDGKGPVRESEVITSGTSLEALLGILFTGGMEATNPYQGFSGESAHYWGGKGLEVGAQYGATRGNNRNEPGVMLVIRSWGPDPVKVVQGETLSRRPEAGKDIVAAVVTDGEETFVLQGPALEALARSSAAWKEHVVSEARRGRLGPFDQWEKVQNRFDPTRR